MQEAGSLGEPDNELAVVIAGATDRDSRVTNFRRVVLEGRVLPESEVVGWLKAQTEVDGPASKVWSTWGTSVSNIEDFDDTFHLNLYEHRMPVQGSEGAGKWNSANAAPPPEGDPFTVPLEGFLSLEVPPQYVDAEQPELTPEVQHITGVFGPNLATSWGESYFGTGNGEHYTHDKYLMCGRRAEDAVRVPVAKWGVLDWLRLLSADLARKNKWPEMQAAYYVLTGFVPEVDLSTRVSIIEYEIPALSRISMDINPVESPNEVAVHYSKVRSGRHRPLTKKHRQLAVFVVTRPQGETWQQTLLAWNNQCTNPAWKYSLEDVRNFRRHCIDAKDWYLRGYKSR